MRRTPRPPRRTASSTLDRAAARPQRRGVAMLLVIIALAMATVVTTSYLASRDNSGAIGDNVVAAAEARWAAVSGLELAVAILETEVDWRSAPGGRIVDAYALGAGTIAVDAIDMETQAAPTAETTWVELVATASVDDLDQIARGYAFVPPSADVVDVDLSEFAAFALEGMIVTDDATITRWPIAPLAPLGRRLGIGTHATAAGSVDFQLGGAAVDTEVYTAPGASGALVLNASSPTLDIVALQDPVPVPAPPSPSAPTPDTVPANPPLTLASTLQVVNGAQRVGSVAMSAVSELDLMPGSSLTVEGDMVVQGASYLRVAAGATLTVFGDLILDNGSIELQPDGSITIFVGGALRLSDGYIGNIRVDPDVRDASGYAPYMDPQRVLVYQTAAFTGDPGGDLWRLERNSVAKGILYGPAADLQIADTSALYGAAVARTIRLTENGVIFHDPALDDRIGYRAQREPIFDGTQRIRSEFTTLTSLDESSLVSLEGSTGTTVQRSDEKVLADVSSVDPGTDPTPRPVPVDFTLLAFGADCETWEELVTP